VHYKKVNVELVVLADEGDAVVAELNAALDRLEERHTIFGGGIETVAFEHSGTRKRSALAHTVAAAVGTARKNVKVALRSHLIAVLRSVEGPGFKLALPLKDKTGVFAEPV
jgi:hypothetical protein